MKKLLVIFTLLIGSISPITISAGDKPIPIVIKKKKPAPIGNGIGYAPINLPIEVTFDDATGVLTVSAPEDMEGRVYVYNVDGTLEGSSKTLNATFTLTSSGMHIVAIEGDSWIGEAKIIF